MASSDRCGHGRFAVSCGVLSRLVKAEATAANMASASASTMLLMAGADVPSNAREEDEPEMPSPANAVPHQARQNNQMTIMYGGHVAVFDGVSEDRAAELMRVAGWLARGGGLADDMRVATKASLRRFMEKRRERLAARAPYRTSCPEASLPSSTKKWKAEEADAGSWLGLGMPGEVGR